MVTFALGGRFGEFVTASTSFVSVLIVEKEFMQKVASSTSSLISSLMLETKSMELFKLFRLMWYM